jgi:hypothetical protein
MASSLFPDPLQMWREAVAQLENDVNSLATGSTKSQEVMRSLHQFSVVSLGMQRMFEKVVGGYLRRANLPSRKEVAELAEALRRIEDKLDRLLPAQESPGVATPRPARTRQPPSVVAPAQESAAPAQSSARKAAPPASKRRRAARAKEG